MLNKWETSKIVFYKVLTSKLFFLDESQKPKGKDQEAIISVLLHSKSESSKFVILPKLREKRQDNWILHLKNEVWQSTKDKNEDGQLSPKQKQSEVSTQKYWRHKDICATFTQRKWGRTCMTFTQKYWRHTGYL